MHVILGAQNAGFIVYSCRLYYEHPVYIQAGRKCPSEPQNKVPASRYRGRAQGCQESVRHPPAPGFPATIPGLPAPGEGAIFPVLFSGYLNLAQYLAALEAARARGQK